MGFMDYLMSALDTSNTGPDGFLQSGLVGNKLMNDMAKKSEELQNRKKPGKLCNETCGVNDERCQACLEEQEHVQAGMQELEMIEKTIENPELVTAKKITKCSLCGAPVEKGEKACPYCDTSYPADAITFDLPESKHEQKQMAQNKAAETYALFVELKKKQINLNQETAQNVLPKFLKGATGWFADQIIKGLPMNATQLKQGAEHYQVSLSEYINGVMTGQMKSVPMMEMEKRNAQMEEERKREQMLYEQNRQIQLQAQEKTRQLRNENFQRQLDMINSRIPQYNGGSARTCYDCTYYSAGARACAQTGRDTNAGDSCGMWRLK